MKHNLIFSIAGLLVLIPLICLSLTNAVSADSNDLLWNSSAGNFQSTSGLGDRDPREIAAEAVNVMLGFIGIMAVIIILLGGFKWMTSAGNDDRVAEAKKIISSGVIGLVIILASYAIAQFVLRALYNATGANG